MGTAQTIRSEVRKVLATPWDRRKGQVVPSSEDIKLSGGAVELDAVFLYADMADSSRLARTWTKDAAAKVIRAFLDATTRVIRSEGGEVRSFDGDRVMGIFIGDDKCTTAARCAIKINHAVSFIVHEELTNAYSDYPESFRIGHCTGLALGEALLVRGGVRNNNDLVSIGKAPNIAAKLSSIRSGYPTYITSDVFDNLAKSSKYGGENGDQLMWSREVRTVGGERMILYRSTWWWES